MKVSLKWVQQYIANDLLKDGEDKLLDKIGSQLGAIDEVIRWGDRYEGIVVVKIIKCEPHPNADNLKICWVDDNRAVHDVHRGDDGLVQIVCGGPNAKADMFAVWIPPGKTVPSSISKDPFILEVREIRGQASNGMLASPSELGISDEHLGILEVKSEDIGHEPKAGELLKGLYNLDDIVIDIENKMFTHRPDLFGILGIARELAGITRQQFASPDWYKTLKPDAFKQTAFEELEFKADNQTKDLVPRFVAIAMSDIKISPSPYWLQSGLTRVGIKPINNVVDVTNFVMHLTGQPLHAFDYDKVKAKNSAGIEARMAKDNEELSLLGGKKIKLSTDNIVIASIGGPAIALGGIMGGADTEVDDNTKNIIIECANFDMYTVRKTSMKHGLFTDAAVRFTKGQSPLQNDVVLGYAVKLMSKLAGAKTASQLADIGNLEQGKPTINVSAEFINTRLGLNLAVNEYAGYLNNVEINTVITGDDTLSVTIPFWRTDLTINEDIVEEVGRLHGFDKFPKILPTKDLAPPAKNKSLDLKTKVRQVMSGAGASELLTYSFVDSKLLSFAGQDETLAFHVRNALSPNLQFYRISLTPSLLEKVHPNVKLGYRNFVVYELGKSHLRADIDDQKLPIEHNRLGVVINKLTKSASYYDAKYYLEFLLNQLNIKNYTFEPLANCQRTLSHAWVQTANSFEVKRSSGILVGSAIIGIIGEPSSKTIRVLKLSSSVSAFELDTDQLLDLSQDLTYQELNKYPSTQQDITIKMPIDTSYQAAYQKINGFFDSASQKNGYQYKLSPLDVFAKDSDKIHKNLSWTVELWHRQKTLTTEEVNNLLIELDKVIKSELSAERL
jgi:phenylalanyl-tRNA synthetase beta chain